MKRKSSVFIFIGALLIFASLALTCRNIWEEQRAGEESSEVKELVMQVSSNAQSMVRESDIEVIPDYVLNPDMEMPTTEVDGHAYIGTLSVPELSLELPVMSDWSYPKLKIAPCRYQGSAYKGDLIIAGHNYRTHFGGLNTLSEGDVVTFTDVDGNLFEYEVDVVEVLEKTAIEEMEAGEWDLTLFTCTYGGEQRVTVRCSQVTD